MSLYRSRETGWSGRGARWRCAFTLMEILVVLAIIGLIVGLAIGQLNAIHKRAQITAADLFVRTALKAPLFSYKMAMGDYPSNTEGLDVLVTAPAQHAGRWGGPYVDGNSIPHDPWGESYHYAYPGRHNKAGYDLWSSGPDRQDGTSDDIGNWDAVPNATASG